MTAINEIGFERLWKGMIHTVIEKASSAFKRSELQGKSRQAYKRGFQMGYKQCLYETILTGQENIQQDRLSQEKQLQTPQQTLDHKPRIV